MRGGGQILRTVADGRNTLSRLVGASVVCGEPDHRRAHRHCHRRGRFPRSGGVAALAGVPRPDLLLDLPDARRDPGPVRPGRAPHDHGPDGDLSTDRAWGVVADLFGDRAALQPTGAAMGQIRECTVRTAGAGGRPRLDSRFLFAVGHNHVGRGAPSPRPRPVKALEPCAGADRPAPDSPQGPRAPAGFLESPGGYLVSGSAGPRACSSFRAPCPRPWFESKPPGD
jgi:hypothetical protein